MPRIHSTPNKVRLLTKIMADPFRLAVVLEDKALVFKLKKGDPEAIDFIRLGTQGGGRESSSLKDHWLWLCKKHAFIHLAITLKERPQSKYRVIKPPLDLSVLQRIDFYPHNGFVRFILRKGPFQLFCRVLLPFLTA